MRGVEGRGSWQRISVEREAVESRKVKAESRGTVPPVFFVLSGKYRTYERKSEESEKRGYK